MLIHKINENNSFFYYDFLNDSKDQNTEDYLSQYGTNFTELSRRGLLEQCFSRENELYQIMETLVRKQKNNPVLLGEPGVGKTAILELFADRIAKKDVPFIFYGYEIIGIDIAKMLAGAKFRGEFEIRLIKVIDQILEQNNIIIFFDELHTLKGSGTNDGSLDAGNILKPALSRPGFRCIGASTPKEYKKIEEDAALNRRFQPIIIAEPSKAETFEILDGMRTSLEIYHNVEYTDSALIEAINLSTKYIGDRTLPDKAVDLLDRAGSREVLFHTDINYISIFEAILSTGVKKLSLLKLNAFRKGDIGTLFVLSEIEKAYKNLSLRWIEEEKIQKTNFKENFLSKFEPKNIDNDFEIIAAENNSTQKKLHSEPSSYFINKIDTNFQFLEKKKALNIANLNLFKFNNREVIFFAKNLEKNFPFSLNKAIHSSKNKKIIEKITSLKKFSKGNSENKFLEKNIFYFLDYYRNEFKNSKFNSVKENEKKGKISEKDLFSNLSSFDNKKNKKKIGRYLTKKGKKKKSLNQTFSKEKKNYLSKINDYKKLFLSKEKFNVLKKGENKINLSFDKYLQISLNNKFKNSLFFETESVIKNSLIIERFLKQISSEKYSVLDKNIITLINNSIVQRVDDLLFFSNKPKFILDNKENIKNLSKKKTTENIKNILTQLLSFNNKSGIEIKTNNLKIKLLNESFLISLYRLGLISLYKEKLEIKNVITPVDNFIKEVYIIPWNLLYKNITKYLYNYVQNLKEFNKVFLQYSLKDEKSFTLSSINDVVLDFLEDDIHQVSIVEQQLDDNNKSKVDILKDFFKSLPPLLHKRYISILNQDNNLLKDQENLNKKNTSLSLFKKEEENVILYNLLGFFSTEKGRNFLSNTNDPELIRVARKIGNYKSLGLEYRISSYEIQRLITNLTGIPVESLTANEMKKLINLENLLHKRVIGQNEAIATVSKAIRRSRLGIQNPSRPIGSFLFCGPTGVGKTELSKALAEAIFGSEKEMIRFDMSEFMERFSVTRLIGSPPGYIGYEEGGQLSDSVRKKPYSLVLFDEIEKAHIEVLNILLQILEDGRLTDSQKRLVSFENTIIIMTSNAAAKEIQLTLENIEKNKKTKGKDEIVIEKSLSKSNNSKIIKKQSKNLYVDARLGKINLIPNIINTNFTVDIRDNIKEKFSKSYSSKIYVNKLYEKFPEITNFNIKKTANQNIELVKKNDLNVSDNNQNSELESRIKGLKKNSGKKNTDQLDVKELVMNKLTKFFLPEFINRLDDIIVFESLTYEDMIKIYDVMVEKLIKRVKSSKINLIIDPSVKGKLVNEGYSKTFGARPLRRLVTKYLEDTLSNTLLNYHGTDVTKISKQGCTVRISLSENDIITGELLF